MRVAQWLLLWRPYWEPIKCIVLGTHTYPRPEQQGDIGQRTDILHQHDFWRIGTRDDLSNSIKFTFTNQFKKLGVVRLCDMLKCEC